MLAAHLEGDLMPGEGAGELLAADSSLPEGCTFASTSADSSGPVSDCILLGAELLTSEGRGLVGLPLPALQRQMHLPQGNPRQAA